MQKNEREILRLKSEKERVLMMNGGHAVTSEDIMRKLKERESELREINMQYETLNIDFTKKERIFNDSKTFISEVLKQIHEAKLQNQMIQQKNVRLHIQVSQHRALQDQLRDIDGERKQIESAII